MYYKYVQVLFNFQEKKIFIGVYFRKLMYILRNCFFLNFKWCQLSVHESS